MSHDKIDDNDRNSLIQKIKSHINENDDDESTVLFKFEG